MLRGLRHDFWTREGRRLTLPTGQLVYKAFVGQRNVELADGSFAPFTWNEDARILRYADMEARFVGSAIEFWRDGRKLATTRPRLQRKTRRDWIDVVATTQVRRLTDEDDLDHPNAATCGAARSARIAITLESPRARVRHVLVAGCRSRARADVMIEAQRAGEYRVVMDHDYAGTLYHCKTQSLGAVIYEGFESREWRVDWTGEESKQRRVKHTERGLSIELPAVRKTKASGDRILRLEISPDTYGPVSFSGVAADDANSGNASTKWEPTGGTGGILFVDDSDSAQFCSTVRFSSINLNGTPVSIDAGTQVVFARAGTNSGATGNKTIRFKCEAVNQPSTGADTASTTTGRYFHRTYASGSNDGNFDDLNTTATVAMNTAIDSLRALGFAYSGGSSDAMVVTGGANTMFGITVLSWRSMGYDQSASGAVVPVLTIVFTGTGGVSGAGAIASAAAFGIPQVTGGVFRGDQGAIVETQNFPFFDAAEQAFGGIPVDQAPTHQTITPYGIATLEAIGSATVSQAAGNAISAAGNIASGAVVSTSAKLTVNVKPTAIASGEALGTAARITLKILAAGIATGNAIGSATLTDLAHVLPSGIASAYASGTLKITLFVLPTGIATAVAVGTPKTILFAKPTGIGSGYASGSASLSNLAHVSPTGVATGYASGTALLVVKILPTGIAGAYASGTAALSVGPVTVSPSGIASGYASGSAKLNLRVVVTGIATGYASGTAKLGLAIIPTGIATAYASGTVTLTNVKAILPNGIASGYVSGSAHVTPGPVTITCTGIASGYVSGATHVNPGAVTVSPSGIASAAALGASATVRQVQSVLPSGIATSYASGAVHVIPGTATISTVGIASAAAFGTARLGLFARASGVATSEAFGLAALTNLTHITPTGIASTYASGTAKLSQQVRPVAIGSSEAFGIARLRMLILPSAIATGEAFGILALHFAPQSISVSGIGSSVVFGATTLTLGTARIVPLGIASFEDFGVPDVALIAGGPVDATRGFVSILSPTRSLITVRVAAGETTVLSTKKALVTVRVAAGEAVSLSGPRGLAQVR